MFYGYLFYIGRGGVYNSFFSLEKKGPIGVRVSSYILVDFITSMGTVFNFSLLEDL